ncbi:MAG: ribbon-helix-helix protein, CopG family, partial [Aggregatilineales bacterium]
FLQIDHRIPYEVAGDTEESLEASDFMVLCASCNRSKSWVCEQCDNWHTDKNQKHCQTCYWHDPATYQHLALRPIKRLELVWTDVESDVFEQLSEIATEQNRSVAELIKQLVREFLEDA